MTGAGTLDIVPSAAGGKPSSSDELALRAAGGDAAAFESIYREHMPQIYGLCLRMTADESRAADLTQDIFIRAWNQLGKYRGGNFGGWIFALGRNLILNDARARSRFAKMVTFEADVATVEPLGARVSKETALTISAAIETLTPNGRTVFQLHDVEGYSAEEIGDLLGISASTVRVHLSRSRRKIAEVLRS